MRVKTNDRRIEWKPQRPFGSRFRVLDASGRLLTRKNFIFMCAMKLST
jgi:hypothetical protein